MIKLIASDVDGTLVVDGSSSLHPELYEVIRKLKKQGIAFVGASGRPVGSMEHIFGPVKDEVYFIAGNGYYMNYEGKKKFFTDFDKKLAASIAADMYAFGMQVMFDAADCVYTQSRDQKFIDWIEKGYKNKVVQIDNLLELNDTILKVAGCIMDGVPEEVAETLKAKYGSLCKVTFAGHQWVDVIDPNLSKGTALKALQEELGILPEETMVFGDQMNDMEMLEQAYYSFAVANAREEVKAAAKFMADSNVNQGPMKIMKLLLEKE